MDKTETCYPDLQRATEAVLHYECSHVNAERRDTIVGYEVKTKWQGSGRSRKSKHDDAAETNI